VGEPTAADPEHAQRHRAFVLVVRARLLRLRLRAACHRGAWLLAHARYAMKRWPGDRARDRLRYPLPGHVAGVAPFD